MVGFDTVWFLGCLFQYLLFMRAINGIVRHVGQKRTQTRTCVLVSEGVAATLVAFVTTGRSCGVDRREGSGLYRKVVHPGLSSSFFASTGSRPAPPADVFGAVDLAAIG